jgi:hypothetical protein
MDTLDNKNHGGFDKFLFSNTTINQFSIYVDDIKAFKSLESMNRFSNRVIYVLLFIMIVHLFIYNISESILFICIVLSVLVVGFKAQIKAKLTNLIEDSFKRYIILHLLDQKEVISFENPIDDTGFEYVNDVLDEIHLFDSSICIIDHIGYTADKKIKSISIKDIDSEKLKKIINLNAITNFSYAPI